MNDFWCGYIVGVSLFIGAFIVGITIASWGPEYDCVDVRRSIFKEIQECEKDPNTKPFYCPDLIKSIHCKEKE